MLLNLFSDPITTIVFLAGIVLAITIHEYSHAASAVRLGDDTPRLMGRLSLDPRAHLDPLGSIMFLLLGFGWGKPVLYNPLRLSKKIDELWIALAGPISNLLLAIGIRLIIWGMLSTSLATSTAGGNLIGFLRVIADVSVRLAAFNMLPIPPLDGSSIIAYFWPRWRSLQGSQIGLIILILLILPFGGTNLLSAFITPIFTFFQHITLGNLVGASGLF